MPSTVSKQNNYYASHHRRQSSQSQTSLPDQVKSASSHIRSTNSSLVLLPSTAYANPVTQRSRTPSASTAHEERSNNKFPEFDGSVEAGEESKDPHDFYRQDQDPFSDGQSAGLHQAALKTTVRDNGEGNHYGYPQSNPSFVYPILGSDRRISTGSTSAPKPYGLAPPSQSGMGIPSTSKSTPSLPGTLRARKASFKDLVARFDMEDVPPLPTNPMARAVSRTKNPIMSSSSPFMPLPAATSRTVQKRKGRSTESPRKTKAVAQQPPVVAPRAVVYDHTNSDASIGSVPAGRAHDFTQRRPLFGEILPTLSALSTTTGYGIQNFHRRRGSEGSPMHSPNAMFSTTAGLNFSELNRIANSPLPGDFTTAAMSTMLVSQANRPQHRRATSDISHTLSGFVQRVPQVDNVMSRTQHAAGFQNRMGSRSRIPVSTHRYSITSESEISSPPSRATSTLGKHPVGATPRHTTNGAPLVLKSSSPRRKTRTPVQIRSPGRRAPAPGSAQSQKSPSLRANIIAPPPKISPPLRSSRPRQPVSAATTAASRAKLAEKFNAMQKQNDDRRSTTRQPSRPPELSDVDLKQRRLKITQALSRSQDLKANDLFEKRTDTSRTGSLSPAPSDNVRSDAPTDPVQNVPAVVVDEAVEAGASDDARYDSVEEEHKSDRGATQTALQAMEGQSLAQGADIDSPTLGHSEVDYSKHLSPLRTHLRSHTPELGSFSAATDDSVATGDTVIDLEPQAEPNVAAQSSRTVFSQVMRMRSPIPSPVDRNHSVTDDDVLDRTDQMSVQLVLRNTTYLDEEEAINKGYGNFMSNQPLPVPSIGDRERGSWTSSIAAQSDRTEHPHLSEPASPRPHPIQMVNNTAGRHSLDQYDNGTGLNEEAIRPTMASDAYTLVNVFLQQQAESGVVDQQLVDRVYQRVVEDLPGINEGPVPRPQELQEICSREMEAHQQKWPASTEIHTETAEKEADFDGQVRAETYRIHERSHSPEGPRQLDEAHETAQHQHPEDSPVERPTFRGHRYKSSLDSAEDWATTSPSVGDWMQFALNRRSSHSQRRDPSQLREEQRGTESSDRPWSTGTSSSTHERHHLTPLALEDDSRRDWESMAEIPTRPPSHSPPPPPTTIYQSIEQASYSVPILEEPQPPLPESVARSVTTVSQFSAQGDDDELISNAHVPRSTSDLQAMAEQRRLKQRRNVIKELVDTEYSYERDMRVLCDIYKQTAEAALSDDDVKIMFGNVDQVQEFARDFLTILKQVVRPLYVMEKSDRKKDNRSGGSSRASNYHNPRVSTAASVAPSAMDMTDLEKDQLTRIGEAFEASLNDMEKVYTDFIRGRHTANKKLEVIQRSASVREWLKECRDNSSDITNAWDLDALLVKPIQRITKYPLLLKQLLDSTPESHPDHHAILKACNGVTEVNVRINEVKKHAELVDQAFARKRKESDVRNGLSKAFGRKAEKLRQHVGIAEMYEDDDYRKIKVEFDNNIVELIVVSNDCQGYNKALTGWVDHMCQFAAAAEAWVDVGHSQHAEAESKLRQFAMVTKGMFTIALPDHTEKVNKQVIQPMEATVAMLNRFKSDPKGLLAKREKRMIDYAQMRNKKDKGEKIDRKTQERMEQWEALNTEAKDRMQKLLRSTKDLVRNCQLNLTQLHMSWLQLWQQKFSAAMAIDLGTLADTDIVKEWQVDFDYQEATALTLGICNGALLTEAVNMISFLTPSTTLNGEDSPRQPSWTNMTKRSTSLHSEVSHPPYTEYPKSSSGSLANSQNESDRGSFAFANGRLRAQSAASGRVPRTPELPRALPTHASAGAYSSHPDTSSGLADESTSQPPRLSVDAPGPSLGLIRPDSPNTRPGSTSTFFSAAPTPEQSLPQHLSTASSVFSSAMPMSDSPVAERQTSSETPRHYDVLFTAASVYEFNIDRSRREAGFPYLTYVAGEIFDVIGERGELWLAKNQDDPQRQVGWIWNKHFAKLAE